jgi:septum formation protein
LAQLRRMSGRTVIFQTALAVLRADTGFEQVRLAPVGVQFRELTDSEIERYLRLEQPYDCAGSAKSETLGIALLAAIHSDDPTALVGLPLIRTAELLRQAGLDPLA